MEAAQKAAAAPGGGLPGATFVYRTIGLGVPGTFFGGCFLGNPEPILASTRSTAQG